MAHGITHDPDEVASGIDCWLSPVLPELDFVGVTAALLDGVMSSLRSLLVSQRFEAQSMCFG